KNQKAKKWRKKSLWYYPRVSELCSEAVATGDFAFDPALGDSGAGEEDAQEGDEEKEWEHVDEDQPEDPVEIATRTNANDFEAEDVARLIGFFAANPGAARAYATLAGSKKEAASIIRASYLQQVLAGIELL
ncbi:hypothetical protein A4X13_0g8650, partial [Tilletia indica]